VDADELRREVAGVSWFHSIPLGHGIVTPGEDNSSRRLARLGIPEDLSGLSVLDVGAWDGFFSFEAERRGASRVLATDSFCWGGEGWGTKAGFDLARRALGSAVEDKEIGVLDLSPDSVGVFDLVLFLDVLYHMRHPLLALERVFSVTGDRLILETHVDLMSFRRPALAFYPGDELADDPTNWWGPNPPAVEAMLSSVGFARVRAVTRPASLPARIRRAIRSPGVRLSQKLGGVWQGRMVFHAWR